MLLEKRYFYYYIIENINYCYNLKNLYEKNIFKIINNL